MPKMHFAIPRIGRRSGVTNKTDPFSKAPRCAFATKCYRKCASTFTGLQVAQSYHGRPTSADSERVVSGETAQPIMGRIVFNRKAPLRLSEKWISPFRALRIAHIPRAISSSTYSKRQFTRIRSRNAYANRSINSMRKSG